MPVKNQDFTLNPVILIADDNQGIVRMLGGVLAGAGYQVSAVSSKEEALAVLPKLQPDLVLLDVGLPDGSAFDICRTLKQDPHTLDIPVLFVTSRRNQRDIITGFQAGGQDYINKPYTTAELLARVQTHLALRQAQKKLKASEARYRELAIRDDLTNFYNTRYLYQTLQGQLDMHRNRSLSVIFMDIDDFKNVVDGYGHLNGSRTIAELADVVRSVLPEGGYGVSYGGDEFVIVLAGHDHNQGMKVADSIRRAIEQTRFLATQDLAIHITVSCGVATFPDNGQTLTELLGCADQALFKSKNKGKNTVTSCSSPV
jgi:diguanylate cyclase (GGDEF)-like protein